MIRRSAYVVSLLVFAVGQGLGIGSAQAQIGFSMPEVIPRIGEILVCDEIFILADASGSSRKPDKFFLEYDLMDAFIDGMPRGRYNPNLGNAANRALPSQEAAPFVRATFITSAFNTVIRGELTPFEKAMVSTRRSFQSAHWTQAKYGKRGVWVVFSDGRADRKDVLLATEKLVRKHQGKLCIYTVLFGDDPNGQELLADMRALGDCGQAYTADQINTRLGMANFIRDVFFEAESDGDGVPDARDKCPDTPRGVPVDEYGCPIDEDGDGVSDRIDRCPGTPKGARVDERGCWVLSDFNFDTASWSIKREFERTLNEVARVLNAPANAGVRVRVDGHTDSSGSDADNRTLSENRANSVRVYLVDQGVSSSRMEIRGFGEELPIRPNTTPANRYLNRRVELTVISGSGVRRSTRERFFVSELEGEVETDGDHDGVPDELDQCAGTPEGARVDERGCWVLTDLNFDTAKWNIKAEFEELLDEVARVLNDGANANIRVSVDGHTDAQGSIENNQTLSQNRAKSVRNALVARGIAESRVDALGLGESAPIHPNDSPENRYLNRRVELTVIKWSP